MPKSISTISSPEFINLEPLDINPLMSSCEIKVLYIGQNRNRTSISKEVATEMSKTLRGAPIVGYYKEQKHFTSLRYVCRRFAKMGKRLKSRGS